MRQPTNREVIGIFYLLIVSSYLGQLPSMFNANSWMSLQSVGINIVHLSGFIFFATAGCYMLTNTSKLLPVVQRSEYFWYATSLGFLTYGVGYFLGNGPWPANNLWGTWFTLVSGFCAYIGYKRAFYIG
jgi:hypothetical protein